MPVHNGLENQRHLKYVGVIEVHPDGQPELWDCYIGRNHRYLLLHWGPGRTDYLCGPPSMWRRLKQVKNGRQTYAHELPIIRVAYEQALELLERQGIRLVEI